jgi:FkbM family methyltransferase
MPELEDRIVAHHVGARGFGVALNCPPRLAKDLVHVVYEADAKCAQEMIAQNKNESFHILPYCLGLKDQPGKLFITKNPYASSNLKPNPQYFKYYCEVHLHGEVDGVMLQGECYDVVYGNDYSLVEVRDVAMRALDSILETGDAPGGLYPDFLSLDTQGSELNILKGGERTFRDHCLALATEIEFHPMYQEQALFSDIFDFALRHGFHFAGFTYLQEISSNRLPIGARAKGFVAFGDALFLRGIDSVRAIGKSPNETYLALMKLAFIALNFGYLEYAMEVVDAAGKVQPDMPLRDKLMARDCYRILFALRQAVGELPPRMPYIERSEMTTARKAILGRNNSGSLIERQNAAITKQAQLEGRRVRNLAFTNPPAAAYKLLRYFLRAALKIPYTDPKEAEILASVPPDLLAVPPGATTRATLRLSPATTPVESILEEYGYAWWADEVRRRRKSAEHCVAGEMY